MFCLDTTRDKILKDKAWFFPTSSYNVFHTRYMGRKMEPEILIYVPEIIIISVDSIILATLNKVFDDRFLMTNMGTVSWFLELNIL